MDDVGYYEEFIHYYTTVMREFILFKRGRASLFSFSSCFQKEKGKNEEKKREKREEEREGKGKWIYL